MSGLLRVALYVLAALALFGAGLFIVAMLAMSSQGIGAVRSDLFAHIVTIYALIGLPVTVFGALWLARRR